MSSNPETPIQESNDEENTSNNDQEKTDLELMLSTDNFEEGEGSESAENGDKDLFEELAEDAKSERSLFSVTVFDENGDAAVIDPETFAKSPTPSAFTFTKEPSQLQTALPTPLITEESAEEEKAEEPPLDKELYFELYDTYMASKNAEKCRNDFLHRRVGNYYRRKRMFHVFLRETKNEKDLEKKYKNYLEEYETVSDDLVREQIKITSEHDSLRNKFLHCKEEEKKLYEAFRDAEIDLAREFASVDSEKEEARKAITERCLKRQKAQYDSMRKMNLAYIKMKNLVQETQEALDGLDNLGPNLRLMDYEQYKLDNRSLKDKLEENDLALTKVRKKCQNAMQELAHLREKVNAMTTDIQNMEEEYTDVVGEYNDSREELNYLKGERDYYRRQVMQMKERSGLLSKTKLLRDMEFTIDEVESKAKQAQLFKDKYYILDRKLKKLRSLMLMITSTRNAQERKQQIEDLCHPKPMYTSSSFL